MSRRIGRPGYRPSPPRTGAQAAYGDWEYGVAGEDQAASVRRTTHLVAERGAVEDDVIDDELSKFSVH